MGFNSGFKGLNQGGYVEKLCSCKVSALVFLNMKYRVRILIDSNSYSVYITNFNIGLLLCIGLVLLSYMRPNFECSQLLNIRRGLKRRTQNVSRYSEI